jgi:phosphatidylinositol alpha 1,6-mannosyltransferase
VVVKRLRLALVTDTFAPQLNGVTRTLDRLVSAVESRGGVVHIETVADPAADVDRRIHRSRSIPFWAYPEMRISVPGSAAMADRLERFRPTLVHATTPFGVGIAGLLASRSLDLPIVSSYHTSYPQYLHHYGLSLLDRIAWPVLRWFHNATRRTYVPSRWTGAELTRHGIERVRVWSRGVDATRFHPRHRDESLRRRLGVSAGGVLIVYVGRIAPEKGIDVAIDAMRRLADRCGDDVRFAFAGDGPAMARSRLRTAPGTTFTGSLSGDDLAAFYASADVLVFPSVTDTFGNVVLEAMASGLPVVASDHGIGSELAAAGSVAMFPAGESMALADEVERLVRDPGRRASLRDGGRRLAECRNWGAIWDELFADYGRVVGDIEGSRLAA